MQKKPVNYVMLTFLYNYKNNRSLYCCKNCSGCKWYSTGTYQYRSEKVQKNIIKITYIQQKLTLLKLGYLGKLKLILDIYILNANKGRL